MFNLTLHDHLHLTFSEIDQRHTFHAAKARSRARWGRRLRGGEALLVGGVIITAAAAALGHGQVLSIVAASLASLALIVLIVNLSFDFDASARAHATCSNHLWALRERYRSLLSDLHDGVLSVTEARLRRDKLIDDLKAIYDVSSVLAVEDPHKPAEQTDTSAPVQPQAPRSTPAPNTLDFSPKQPAR